MMVFILALYANTAFWAAVLEGLAYSGDGLTSLSGNTVSNALLARSAQFSLIQS